ncbi:probable acyl-CoA dehydrogenase 6 [Corticium candelabrum]|uniref:probable acyl-CoA dehydrogenase 6 n=1 Tax=Corticium candelabrum TaxID=121492 RepID=UPI002E339B5B|nr:probable acyl-CoA dehydrogenase 6 [Corticium candelabrum]
MSMVRNVSRAWSVRPIRFRRIGALLSTFELSDEAIFTSEHEAMRSSLRKLIDEHINPYVDEWEYVKSFPAHEVLKKLGKAGFLGVTKPPECGGLGLDFSYSAAVTEELGHITCGGISGAIAMQADMATPALARFGSDELKKQFLVPSIAGDYVACLGVSEAGAGSDVASRKTTARPTMTSEDLVINGGKMWITNGAQADWMCLLANTREGRPHQNKSLICVPMDAKGITISRKIEKLGHWSADSVEIAFQDVRVPKTNIIGEEGKGFQYQMMQFQEERMGATALVLEPMQRLIEQTVEYTQNRRAFGQSILDNQVVHYRIAELQTELEALRSMHYRCIGMYVKGKDITPLASMAKLKAGRLVRQLTDSLLQYWGGMGYTSEVEVSRQYRDMRLLSIGAGADEVMLYIICKWMGTLPRHM